MQTSAAQDAITAPRVSSDESVERTTVTGLEFPRNLTRPGVDPFDEVDWELRAAIIGNEKGHVVFEQRDVEIPASGRSRPPTSSSRSIFPRADGHCRA